MTRGRRAERVRVAVFNPIFAHYRRALIQALAASEAAEYHFFADTQCDDGIPAADLDAGIAFTPSPSRRLLGRLVWQPAALRQAWSGQYDCFVFMGDAAWASTWIAAALARLRRRRVLLWTHGWTRRDGGLKKHVRLAFYRLAHGLLLYGDRAAAIGAALGYPRHRLRVVFNSLDFEAQQRFASSITVPARAALRTQLFGDASTPVVIAAARLTAVKRFDLLVDALAIVNRAFRPVNLLVVGDGPERGRLRALADAASLKAAFVGACYDEARTAAYFLAASVTVSPGNVGLTCMHSLGYGVPVITHDDPDEQMPEWEAIEVGVTGDLFRKDCALDLARKIERWTREPLVSESLRERCRSRIAQRYHPKLQAAAIEAGVLGGVPR